MTLMLSLMAGSKVLASLKSDSRMAALVVSLTTGEDGQEQPW